ncbi:MAG TPA: UDP-2,3-diacylglucosamine diphosphatase [candidate division Zixibacteria bacterium]|nr:UDP-2,3-diacylglucosamine diphosphatase [candidate division Zixibacteria bacterium]
MSSSGKPTYFFSDAHLGVGDDDDRLRRMGDLFDEIAARGGDCFILGDLFDFWFEFFTGIPTGYDEALAILKSAVEHGVGLHLIGGNHDYWVGKKITQLTGCLVHKKPFIGEIDGKMIYAGHGDGLAPSDWGYRSLLKPILRFPPNIFLYKLLPRSIGEKLARSVSDGSRIYTKNRNLKFEAEYLDVAQGMARDRIDFVIVGHTHEPAKIVPMKNITYVNLGDFFEQFTYAVLERGEVRLGRVSKP